LYRREVTPPFKPRVAGPKDFSNFDREFTEENALDSYDPSSMTPEQTTRHKYEGFTFNP
jgi:Protein kinase C terminal domain.